MKWAESSLATITRSKGTVFPGVSEQRVQDHSGRKDRNDARCEIAYDQCILLALSKQRRCAERHPVIALVLHLSCKVLRTS